MMFPGRSEMAFVLATDVPSFSAAGLNGFGADYGVDHDSGVVMIF
jgi:hypothetical protein